MHSSSAQRQGLKQKKTESLATILTPGGHVWELDPHSTLLCQFFQIQRHWISHLSQPH